MAAARASLGPSRSFAPSRSCSLLRSLTSLCIISIDINILISFRNDTIVAHCNCSGSATFTPKYYCQTRSEVLGFADVGLYIVRPPSL